MSDIEQECRVDIFRDTGPGPIEWKIPHMRITHLETGLVVQGEVGALAEAKLRSNLFKEMAQKLEVHKNESGLIH